ncbi:MAG: hypothetical protein ACK550_17660, partial [Synechococcaceae cyanobacterium]
RALGGPLGAAKCPRRASRAGDPELLRGELGAPLILARIPGQAAGNPAGSTALARVVATGIGPRERESRVSDGRGGTGSGRYLVHKPCKYKPLDVNEHLAAVAGR